MTDAEAFVPKLDILPPPQRRLWDELAVVPSDFVLYGGTALALHLGHRTSQDFDFFLLAEFSPAGLVAMLPFLANAIIVQQSPNTLIAVVDRGGPVNVSFFGLPRLRRIRPPLRAGSGGVRVASLLDLAGTKVAVVQQRAEAKDYIDIDALLSFGVDLLTALAAARMIYGPQFNPLLTLKALSYFGDGNLGTLSDEVARRLASAVREVDLTDLPSLDAGTSTNFFRLQSD